MRSVATKMVRAEDESRFSRVSGGCSSPVTPIADATHCAGLLVRKFRQETQERRANLARVSCDG